MNDQPYRRVTEFHFTVNGWDIAITDVDRDFVTVSEVDKNGQEDTHMSGVLQMPTMGRFVWIEGENMFRTYGSDALADGIRKYLNKHGMPNFDAP